MSEEEQHPSLTEVLPSGKTYAIEEWQARTWWGRWSVPFEALLVSAIHGLARVQRELPDQYKDDNALGTDQ